MPGAVVCLRLSTASSQRPTLCAISAWAFPLPVTLSPLLSHYSASREPLRPCPARGHNAGHMPTHYTYTEAARILGVSRRTISRRIQSGELPTVEVDGARRVVLDIPDGAQPAPDAPTGTPGHVPAQEVDIAQLRARLEAVESERDHLRATVDKLAGTVDRLTISLAQLTGTVVEQRALDAGIDTPEVDTDPEKPVQRRWWAFWRA